MPLSSFEKNSVGWQLAQWRQQIGEWLELKTSQTLSNASVPSWLTSPLLWTLVKVVCWIILGLLLTWAIWQLWQLLRPYFYTLKNKHNQSVAKAIKTSVRELSAAGWLQRSQKLQQQGNYREACLCLYRAMLQRLNDTGIAPHQSSRTDGEYLQLVQQLSQSTPYQTLLMTHQQLCFSNTEAS
ncbi:MAG: DUF4129 domain-containing protein, partial [Coleofasciculus sp. S288]|nr:DUF4129 domain-containing protein [Coleofasciculus sp. S288]